ncbi:TuaF [Fictibacillus macauensis ZFHKF-1]|uniref:TuaF n=1 Tax=Fictibacillus macauensis ZFHKF-1 TaxID=1196324 RepID=I8AMM0_9BACL|nr:hypothetical protein [Fictibacillus macauensis]EIT86929.1 TuaF [Fictibacillus macauensis ZFHKF-1]
MQPPLQPIVRRLKKRLRNYALFFIAVVLLTTVLSYVMALRAPEKVTVTASVKMGQVETSSLNNAESAATFIKSETFRRMLSRDAADLLPEQLQTYVDNEKILTLSLSGSDASSLEKKMQAITTAFLHVGQQQAKQWKRSLSSQIKNVKRTAVTGEAIIAKQEYLFDLKTRQQKITEPLLLEQKKQVMTMSKNKKALLGFLVGITLDLVLLCLPELLRKEEFSLENGPENKKQ